MNYLPTDNLYKFCAIAGLIIVGFSIYYPFNLVTTLRADVIEVGTDLGILKAESDYLTHRLKKLENVIENTIARQSGRHKRDPNKLEISYSEQEVKNFLDEIDRLKRDEPPKG